MFDTRKELTAKLKASETENEELRTDIEGLESKVEESKDQTEKVASLTSELEQSNSDLDEAKSEWVTAKATLTSKLEAAEAKATPEAIQAIVADELAKCSHDPIETTASTADSDSKGNIKNLTGLAKVQAALKAGK